MFKKGIKKKNKGGLRGVEGPGGGGDNPGEALVLHHRGIIPRTVCFSTHTLPGKWSEQKKLGKDFSRL